MIELNLLAGVLWGTRTRPPGAGESDAPPGLPTRTLHLPTFAPLCAHSNYHYGTRRVRRVPAQSPAALGPGRAGATGFALADGHRVSGWSKRNRVRGACKGARVRVHGTLTPPHLHPTLTRAHLHPHTYTCPVTVLADLRGIMAVLSPASGTRRVRRVPAQSPAALGPGAGRGYWLCFGRRPSCKRVE